MPNSWFKFKQFTILQEKSAMKVGTDGVLLGAWANAVKSKSILDIGTGTGIIALMLAQRFSANIVAIEIDKNSYIEAEINIENSPWENRIQILHKSLQEYANNNNTKFDCIVSNPPYFINSLKSDSKSKNLARHTDSLSFYELFHFASKLLSASGCFSLIAPFDKKEFITEIALNEKMFCNRQLIVKGKADTKAKRILMEFGFHQNKLENKTLVIENELRHDYTKEYIELTKDFYLNF